ncbi:MAG: hypothetical protein MZV64_02280 [Ignavibacteriales bacterium]|nr:hypothetical protein [Ignavibacteriales bacterium]
MGKFLDPCPLSPPARRTWTRMNCRPCWVCWVWRAVRSKGDRARPARSPVAAG